MELFLSEQFKTHADPFHKYPSTHKHPLPLLTPLEFEMFEQFTAQAVPFHWKPTRQKHPVPFLDPLELGTDEQLMRQLVPFHTKPVSHKHAARPLFTVALGMVLQSIWHCITVEFQLNPATQLQAEGPLLLVAFVIAKQLRSQVFELEFQR
jgi:hypothetical protein